MFHNIPTPRLTKNTDIEKFLTELGNRHPAFRHFLIGRNVDSNMVEETAKRLGYKLFSGETEVRGFYEKYYKIT